MMQQKHKLSARVYVGSLVLVVSSIALSWPALAQDSAPSANLLPNPSFEEKAGDSVKGWRSRAWSGETNTQWRVESPGRTGKQSVSVGSEKGADAAWTATVAVERDAFYRLSGWIKTKEVRGALGA